MPVLLRILDFFAQIPGTFWGIIVGSSFTLIGIALTNFFSDRRQMRQHAFEHRIQRQYREFDLRRDVYLNAVKSVSTALNAIGRLANIDTDQELSTGLFGEHAGAVDSIHIVASSETARAISSFVGSLNASYLKLLSDRIPLAIMAGRIRSLGRELSSLSNKVQAAQEKLRQLNASGDSFSSDRRCVDDEMEECSKQFDDVFHEIEPLDSALSKRRLEFTKKIAVEVLQLQKLLVPVVSAVREDLGLQIESNEYEEIMKLATKPTEDALNILISGLEELN